jgi:hypothetical protein
LDEVQNPAERSFEKSRPSYELDESNLFDESRMGVQKKRPRLRWQTFPAALKKDGRERDAGAQVAVASMANSPRRDNHTTKRFSACGNESMFCLFLKAS